MPERLSAPQTWFMKFCLVLGAPLGSAWLLLVAFLRPGIPLFPDLLLLLAFLTLTAGYSVFVGVALRRVDLAGDHLIISDFVHETSMPVREITEVRVRSSLRVVVITFATRSPLGRSIAFIPAGHRLFTEPAVAQQLRELAGIAS